MIIYFLLIIFLLLFLGIFIKIFHENTIIYACPLYEQEAKSM